MIKLNDYVKIENRGIGKVEQLFPADDYSVTGTIVINIADVKYYREIDKNNVIIDDLNDTTKSNKEEYMTYLKVMIQQLTEQAKNKRKQAAEFNKESNGEAVKRKGKVTVIDNNITSLVENSLSSHHRGLLSDAKKTKEIKDKLKKELAILKQMTA